MRIESGWKITVDPDGGGWVLLDYGWLIDAEINWTLKKSVQVTQLDESEAPFLRHAGNAVVSLEFKVYTTQPVDAVARGWVLDSLRDLAQFQKYPLRVEVRGISTVAPNTFWQFAQAYITEHSPMRDVEAAGIIRSYAVTATNLQRY